MKNLVGWVALIVFFGLIALFVIATIQVDH
jgi:hypothetical protein